MDYRITCICGHSFQVPEQKLKSRISCPACGQPLSAVPDLPGTAPTSGATASDPIGEPIAATAEPTKRCPFCGEVVLAIARKCKHCGEFLDRQHPSDPATPLSPASAGTPDPQTPPADIPPIYSLTVSQWDNFWRYLILLTIVAVVAAVLIMLPPLKEYAPVGIPAALVFAGFIAWYFFLSTKNTRCYIRPTRIDTESGILSKDLNSLELFRITDMELKQGIFERILGIGTIKLMTNDSSSEPELILYQIPQVRLVYKYIQTQIPIAAKQRGAFYMEK